MNGGSLPMLGGHGLRPGLQNAGVKKALTPFHARVSSGETGFTLIEVMVALIVLVMGVLGAAAMTLNAVRDNKQSSLRSQASAFAYEMSDIMRSNRNPGLDVTVTEPIFTTGSPAASASCWTTGCTLPQSAANDYYEWLQKLQSPTSGLPNATAVICRDKTLLTSPTMACDNNANSPLVVKIRWDEKQSVARGQQTTTNAVTTQVLAVPIQPFN